eukprot:Hpha_TRINITY_DN16836_c0_g3::TRINITY_DN16836_c0_g3_i1::g.149661::m.149661
MAPLSDAKSNFPVGSEVEAHSLVTMLTLNGLRGKVTNHRLTPDGAVQVVVQFGPPNGLMALKITNLKKPGAGGPASPSSGSVEQKFPVGKTVEAKNLVAMKQLNGVKGTVNSHRKAGDGTDQIVVSFPAPHGMLALRVANLELVDDASAPAPAPAPDIARVCLSIFVLPPRALY